ncbi:MAG: hypothetical protein LAO77_19315 [Acidobacteriia bacterium]|nr:hypothetical protein [Terriglobia bacterium]
MNAVWALAALGVVGAVLAIAAAWRRSNAPQNLGAVSDQWISEHRLGSTQDSRR